MSALGPFSDVYARCREVHFCPHNGLRSDMADTYGQLTVLDGGTNMDDLGGARRIRDQFGSQAVIA